MSANFKAANGDKLIPTVEFNVSNERAASILGALGFNPEFWIAPPINAGAFFNACQSFLSNSDLQEILDGGKQETSAMNFTYCSTRAGYLVERITDLKNITRVAMERGATLVYFV